MTRFGSGSRKLKAVSCFFSFSSPGVSSMRPMRVLFSFVFFLTVSLVSFPWWGLWAAREPDVGSNAPSLAAQNLQKFNLSSGESLTALRTSVLVGEDGNSSIFAGISSADGNSSSPLFVRNDPTRSVSPPPEKLAHFRNGELPDLGKNSTASMKRSEAKEKNIPQCDLTKGEWVVDEGYPLYTTASCPFIDEGFNCEGNGRLDKRYMRWRWQPEACAIDRFNATRMLELIRGKRLVFVGDSLNRNQWESMLCLLLGGVRDPKKVYEARGRKITKETGNYSFKFEEYKCTVEFYVSHFLVHEGKARVGRKRKQTLRIDTIDKGSSRWRGADILVFNTAHWWSHQKTRAGVNYYQEGDRVLPRLDVMDAFRRAISTWASWVDRYINPSRTLIFFRSSAPSHFSGGLWNSGGHCQEALNPINRTLSSHYPERNTIVEEIISRMRTPVTLLNITRLSDYRPDAHPSIYGRRSSIAGVEDCSHWCLPGVPDTWNQLLYHHLLQRTIRAL